MKWIEKRNRDKCHQSFRQILNLVDLTDRSMEELCEKCADLPDPKQLITLALDQVLTLKKNGATGSRINRPKYLCIFYEDKKDSVLTGDIYRSTTAGFEVLASGIGIQKDSCTSFQVAREEGFALNASDDPSSVREFQEQISPRIRDLIKEPLWNCVGYHIHGDPLGVLIGFNYPRLVGRFESKVMKSLSTTVSSLFTLARQINEIKKGFIYLVEALARASEVNDEDTGNHIARVNAYAGRLARIMNQPEEFCREIALVAQLHDVGKIHTPSEILTKPGPLTPREREIMEQHTLQGEIILGQGEKLVMARNIACAHHENYDGSGYPRGLKGDEIPMEAQIVKVADVYDALRSKRPYKPPLSHTDALRIMNSSDGEVRASHINPDLLRLFLENSEAFREIYENLG